MTREDLVLDYGPIAGYMVLVVLYRLSELVAMLRTGTLRKRPKWDGTLFFLWMAFVGTIIGPMAEYLWGLSDPGASFYIAGGGLVLAGTVFRVRGHLDLGLAFSGVVELSEEHELVEKGLYAHVRHPLYLGTLALYLGFPLFLAARVSWAFTLVGFVALFFRIRKEERFLAEHLPGYRDYMGRTRALIPGVF